ncbi:DUF4442 domain-containing protein [Psychroflexus sp. CAK57W]|uniref:DUF4442 domain-containing protein n=1 Tax=Psychroflexus curvus TaxID=2873595 RepID=UPI001CCCC137|nr:DUF4442 domain-containing protein [Psychroflexus curvus]MBZ9628540.1 DUF4442 domain-containing protein [Psychroflexus curvus]MBZ9788012.1 DUF4442 domain-containing protein [Psychroflexus curvus]
MKLSPSKINLFLFTKLPSAWLCGVRLKTINEKECITTVTHKWINQNPFNSMYFAVQAMAAELSTGAIVMKEISGSGEKISMLVQENSSSFHKKAKGKITFNCKDVDLVKENISKCLTNPEGQKFWMTSIAKNETGEIVSEFKFQWTIRKKKNYGNF